MSVSIVTTTINKPILLAEYCKNISKNSYKDVNFIIIGDKKTPLDVSIFCDTLSKQSGYKILYYDIPQQLEYLKKFPDLAKHLPYNSIQRRNIGLLMAYELGSNTIITIDDDNLVTKNDFIGYHSIVSDSKKNQYPCIASDNGWFNVCEMLVEEEGRPFYHRGFPIGQRWKQGVIKKFERNAEVVVNAGLWLNDPDIDAITRMDMPIKATNLKEKYTNNIVLDIGTWCPFNSQNTAFARKTIPAYFLSPNIGRYDDIWASYFLRKIIDHLNDAVMYGNPLVNQERNLHNLRKDLESEFFGMDTTDRLIKILRNMNLVSTDYLNCYSELTEKLEIEISKSGLFNQFENNTFCKLLDGMKIWANTFSVFKP